MLQKIVLEKLVGRSPALDIHAQTDGQESFQLFTELLWLLEAGCAIGSNEIKSFERLFVQVGWLGLDHLNCHDTQGPDINLGTVLFLLDDFGSHPVRRANHSGSLRFGLCEFGAEAKIGLCLVSSSYSAKLELIKDLLIFTLPRASNRTLSLLISR